MMIGIFLVGVGAGLSGLWWLDQENTPQASSGQSRNVEQASSGRTADPTASAEQPGPGISREELPYDGGPLAERVPRQDKQEVAKASPAPRTESGPLLSSGSSGIDEPVDAAARPPVASNRPEPSASDMAAAAPVLKPERSARLTEKPVNSSPDSSPDIATTNPLMMDDKKTARRTERDRAVQPRAKDTEIDRMKREAADELKKKNDAARSKSLDSARNSAPSNQNGNDRQSTRTAALRVNRSAAFARCEQNSNIILREKCKWEVCSGRWGRDGCPSYQTDVNNVH